MPNPVVILCRKASSFRDKTKAKPKVPQKRPPSIELDHYFSIDTFLRRMKSIRSKSVPRKRGISMEEPIMKISQLPQRCLEKIFSHLSHRDLLTSRLVSHQFNASIIISRLLLRSLNHLKLNGNGHGQIHRQMRHRNAEITSFPGHEVHHGLKFITSQKVTVENAIIHEAVIDSLLKGINYFIEEINFSFCQISVTPDMLANLISSWQPKKVVILNCKWLNTKCLDGDSLLAYNPQIEHFAYSQNNECQSLQFSETSLEHLLRFPKLPEVFDLMDCRTDISVDGIKRAVKAYLSAASNSSISLNYKCESLIWHFGKIVGSPDAVLEALQPHLSFSKSVKFDESLFEITFPCKKSFPGLCLSMTFLQPDPFSSSSDEEEILWDDTDEESP